MTTPVAIVLLAAALAAAPDHRTSTFRSPIASPASDEELRSQVDAYLSSIDTPVPADRWRALGPRAVPILEQKATSPQAFPSRRARAIEALAVIGSSRQVPLLVDLARSGSEPFAVRAAALRSTARLLPAPQAVAALRPLLEGAGSPRLRAAAADALARSAGAPGCAAARAQAEQELPEHRAQFQRALRRCEQ